MEEEKKEEEFAIEPVEIHPEMYSANLFGEPPAKEIASVFTLSFEPADASSTPPPSESLSPSAKGAFNIWALTDAFAARQKRDCWVLYRKALAAGLSPEEVFYKLVWQAKTLLIAKNTSSAAETDMKPFPYNKAKAALKNFKSGELEKLSERLVLGYHAVRRGEGEMETLVEKTLLRL